MKTVANYVILVSLIIFCECAGMVSGLLSRSGWGTWYAALRKPVFMPPGWLFGPVWVALYALMSIAAWQAYVHAPSRRFVAVGLALFAVQLALNVAWSPLFFGLHKPGWALVDCVAMWLAIIATMVCFWQASRGACLLMVPYLLWVSFAAVLNAAVWRLNR